ncbi:unnamed protein product, partial [Nesidiocoris tenuis]
MEAQTHNRNRTRSHSETETKTHNRNRSQSHSVVIFGSDQEVAEMMRAVRRCNATGIFSWIGSDGWSARDLVSIGNEHEFEEKDRIVEKHISY